MTQNVLKGHKTEIKKQISLHMRAAFCVLAIICAEIYEITQIFKGDLIKFCEIFTKIFLDRPQNCQKPLFKSLW